MQEYIQSLENFQKTLEDNIKANYSFFSNKDCEYYPCHNIEEINCLFCFCPLYNKESCGGNFKILENGTKDCSNCNIPHDSEKSYLYIISKIMNL